MKHQLYVLTFFVFLSQTERTGRHSYEAPSHQERGLQNGELTILALLEGIHSRKTGTNCQDVPSKGGFAHQAEVTICFE